MSRYAQILTPVILVMIVLSGCFGCDEEPTTFPNFVTFLPADPISLNVGDSKTVPLNVSPFGSSQNGVDLGVTSYASSDGTVATVDASGRVTCVTPGTATITATNTNRAGTGKATLQVTCNAATPPPPTGAILTVTPSSLSFTHTVGVTACPESIGTLHLSTARNETVNVTLSVTGTSAVTLGSTTGQLNVALVVDVPVGFDCSTQQNFTGIIVVNATSATTSGSVTVPVTSNIK